MEAGVEEGVLQRNRLIVAEQNWEAQRAQLANTVRAIENQAVAHVRQEQEEAAVHAERAKAAAAISENEAAALRRSLEACENELGQHPARASDHATRIRALP